MVCLFLSRHYPSGAVKEVLVASDPTELVGHLRDHPTGVSDRLERCLDQCDSSWRGESWFTYDGVIGEDEARARDASGIIRVINFPDMPVSEDGRAWVILNDFTAWVVTSSNLIETAKMALEQRCEKWRDDLPHLRTEVREVDIIWMPKSKSALKT
jgi:hypothetical protein